MARYNIVKGQRKYYKDGVEVPSSSITDFGSYRYFKNVVTTKYWKEITTTSNDVVYACYRKYASSGYVGWYYYYAKTPIGSDMATYYRTGDLDALWPGITNDASQISKSTSIYFTAISETNATLSQFESSKYNGKVCDRYPEGDAYGDITTTTVVEGTPEDYTYTTEESSTIEVTANDDYDYTEFVPSTQFDNYEGTNKLYQLAKVKRSYYKDGVVIPKSSITDFGGTKYYKNIITTKYWKEITTGGRELEYYCYLQSDTLFHNGYYYANLELTKVFGKSDLTQAISSNELVEISASNGIIGSYNWKNLTEESVTIGEYIMSTGYYKAPRYRDGDLYKDTTVTETVEGTPEDYTYATEETETIEVSADDDYDYTEIVPSTQFDYYTDRLLSYEIIKGIK